MLEGTVVETLPNGTCLVELSNGHRLIGWWPKRVERSILKPGDRVQVEVKFFDLSHGKLIKKVE